MDRVHLPELMDDPTISQADHFHALRGLARLNWWSGNARLSWQILKPLLPADPQRALRVLDIATGAADVPIGILQKAGSRASSISLSACDISGQALAFAQQRCTAAGVDVNLFQLDIIEQDIPEDFDVVMCSTFLHHLSDAEALTVLQKMWRAAKRKVVVVDLLRSSWNWMQVWFATRLLSTSKIVHYDGPQSIRAAYTIAEIKRFMRDLEKTDFTLATSWPCRFVLVGNPEGNVQE